MSVLAVLASVKLMKPAPATSAFTTSGEGGISASSSAARSRGFLFSGLASCSARLEAKSPWLACLGRSRTIGVSISSGATLPSAWRNSSASRDFGSALMALVQMRNPQLYRSAPFYPCPVTPQRTFHNNIRPIEAKGTARRDPASPQECQRGITEHARSTHHPRRHRPAAGDFICPGARPGPLRGSPGCSRCPPLPLAAGGLSCAPTVDHSARPHPPPVSPRRS